MEIFNQLKMELGESIDEELFGIYTEKVRTLIEVLGLSGWDISFMHTSELGKGDLSITVVDIPNRDATFMLNKSWREPVSKRKIQMVAAHEVLELMMARIRYLATNRYVREGEIDEEIHSVIRRLENVLFVDLDMGEDGSIYSAEDNQMIEEENPEEEGFEMEFDIPGLNEEEPEEVGDGDPGEEVEDDFDGVGGENEGVPESSRD